MIIRIQSNDTYTISHIAFVLCSYNNKTSWFPDIEYILLTNHLTGQRHKSDTRELDKVGCGIRVNTKH